MDTGAVRDRLRPQSVQHPSISRISRALRLPLLRCLLGLALLGGLGRPVGATLHYDTQYTTNFSLTKPGYDSQGLQTAWDANMDTIDAYLYGVSTTPVTTLPEPFTFYEPVTFSSDITHFYSADLYTDASGNVALGYGMTGVKATNGIYNTTYGYLAGPHTGSVGSSDVTAIGFGTGGSCAGCTDDTFLGVAAGAAMTTGGNNTLVGSNAGSSFLTSNNSVVIGFQAAQSSTGTGNTFLGARAGQSNSGDRNVFINSGGSFTDPLGDSTISNFLSIQGGNNSKPLIEGNFVTGTMYWGIPGINRSTYTAAGGLQIPGPITASSGTFGTSNALTIGLQGDLHISSAAFVGLSLSTQTGAGAGAATTVLCPVGRFATGGGCSCTGAVAPTGEAGRFNSVTAGALPNGYVCQEPGGTGGDCAAFVMCSRLQ